MSITVGTAIANQTGGVPRDMNLDLGLLLFTNISQIEMINLAAEICRISRESVSTLTDTLSSLAGDTPRQKKDLPVEDMVRLLFRAIGRSGVDNTINGLSQAADGIPRYEKAYFPLFNVGDIPKILQERFEAEFAAG